MTTPNDPQDLVSAYLAHNYRIVLWPAIGAQKGPTETGWTSKRYTLADYREGLRVGLLTGVEVSPGHFLHDVDLDWAPGANIALVFLPSTSFVYGRASKKISHCFYTLPEALHSVVYHDPIDKTMLIELRGTKENGEIGWQSMAPPSIWSNKEGLKEPLEFKKYGDPAHILDLMFFKQRICLAAIGMLLAKHFGHNGFGHDARLAWAGFLLRAGILPDDLVLMGEAMSTYCNNKERTDVRQVVDSTVAGLARDGKKIKGAPALIKLLGTNGRKIVAEINSWLGRESDFVRTADGLIVKDHQANVRRALQLLGVELSYQTFAERLLIKQIDSSVVLPLDDNTVNRLWLQVDRECRFRPSFVFFEKVVKDTAHDNAFHPVRDYLNSLTWDNTPRIDTWLTDYAGAEDGLRETEERRSYLAAVASIVLIAAVRRVRHPGCKYDEMLVLESEQGLNKSSALRALCPNDEWFSDDLPLNVDAKQIIERTLGKWIIEASDLVGGRKADRDHLKSMLSRQIDGPARLAYAHLPVERPRQFIIIGTTNSAEYLADMTGARRFWPVKVRRFDVDGLLKARDQLWAEAATREAHNESIRLPEELWGEAGEQQEQRREVDAWEQVITTALADIETSASGRRQVAAGLLWDLVGVTMDRRDRQGAKRLSEIMQRLGFTRQSIRIEGAVETGYVQKIESHVLLFPSDKSEKPPF